MIQAFQDPAILEMLNEALEKAKKAEERILKGDREYGAKVQQLQEMASVLESKVQKNSRDGQ